MLSVRCKECNRELHSTTKVQCCGCPNQMTVVDDKVSALDLSKVIMLNSTQKEQKNVLSQQDLMFQEERRQRKVRKLDFEIR